MRVEFAKVRLSEDGAEVAEIAHLGDFRGDNGKLKFADGTIGITKTRCGVNVDLSGLKDAGLFHGRHLRRLREIGLGKDGGGCAQIDKDWIIVVHKNKESGIYKRLGRKAHNGYHHESYWHT